MFAMQVSSIIRLWRPVSEPTHAGGVGGAQGQGGKLRPRCLVDILETFDNRYSIDQRYHELSD